MYDILQLNDMLVPELLDIAEELKIENAKKLDKQGLIYKILDKQAVMGSQQKEDASDKPKRKRIVKASTANSTEEAVVEETADTSGEVKKTPKKAAAAPRKEAPKKATKKKSEEQQELELPQEQPEQPKTQNETIPSTQEKERSQIEAGSAEN